MKTNYSIAGGVLGAKAVSLTQYDQFLDWLVDGGAGDEPQELYRAVAWAFWCANLRADSVAQVPYAIYREYTDEDEEENEFEGWEIDLSQRLWLVEAWLALTGHAFLLKRTTGGVLTDLQVLNANTVEVHEWDNDGPTVFRQKVGSQWRDFPAEQMVYFRTFNPRDDINAGVSSGHVAQAASQLVYNVNEWAVRFFENGAIPAVILETESAIPDNERERIRTTWKRMVGGVRNVWETLVLRKGMKVQVVTPPVKDLAMPELERTKRDQILAAHKIPPGLAEAKTNRAERSALQFEFWTQCIKPEVGVWLKPALNEQLFNPMGLRIAWDWNEIEAIQVAELEKAEAMAFAINGVILPAYQSNLVSVEEARSWINAVGTAAALPPLDEDFTPEERVAPQPFGQPQQPGPGQTEGGNDQGERTRPKAQPPEWGRLRVSLPN
jgi:HK97 family phage portal protein